MQIFYLAWQNLFFHVTNFIFVLSKSNLALIYLLFLLLNILKVTT